MMILKRHPESREGDESFLVHHDGKVVGRIFNRLPGTGAAVGASWFWGVQLDFQEGRSPPFYGDAATREEAMAAFKRAWGEPMR